MPCGNYLPYCLWLLYHLYHFIINSWWWAYIIFLFPPIFHTTTILWSRLGWERVSNWLKIIQTAFMATVEQELIISWFLGQYLHHSAKLTLKLFKYICAFSSTILKLGSYTAVIHFLNLLIDSYNWLDSHYMI